MYSFTVARLKLSDSEAGRNKVAFNKGNAELQTTKSFLTFS